jgi:hypothetical protein
MTKAFMESMKFDIDIRIPDESKPDLRKMVNTHEFSKPGVILENDKVKVTAVRNIHPPIADSFALRFDTKDRSVVFSGDTTYCPAVAELAKGADVLVHEVIYVPAVDAMVKRVPNAATLKEHLLACTPPRWMWAASLRPPASRSWCSRTSCRATTPASPTKCCCPMCASISRRCRGGKDLMVI